MAIETGIDKEKSMAIPELHGVARTLLLPLACRAAESVRPDAILHDPRAVEVFNALGGNRDFQKGMNGFDVLTVVMRARQFDAFAQAFLAAHPGGLVVDIGCGLDTRFDRLDDGQMTWLGIDLPEVIELRRQVLPDEERCRTLAQSILDLSWLDQAARANKPVIFLAEGVFMYFSFDEIKPMLSAMAARFPGGELVFDALPPYILWLHKLNSSILRASGVEGRWDVKNLNVLDACGLTLLEHWRYFDRPEPRMGAASLMRYIPPLANGAYILHYRLGR